MITESQEKRWQEQARWIRENFKKYKTEYSNYIHVVYVDGIPQVLRGDLIPMTYQVMDDFIDCIYRDFRDCPDCGKLRLPKKSFVSELKTKTWKWVCLCGYESIPFWVV